VKTDFSDAGFFKLFVSSDVGVIHLKKGLLSFLKSTNTCYIAH